MPRWSERCAVADRLAAEHGWHAETLAAGEFELRAYVPDRLAQGGTLVVYLEGDGFAWRSPSQPSEDPTPLDPLALRLALAHPGNSAVYLARPCQYVGAQSRGCGQRYWTAERFAPEVIDAGSRALDALERRAGARRLLLIGYSGGGAVAALLAARRADVELLVTLAGNLDHAAWTAQHQVQPLTGSLNPADEIAALVRVPQLHWVGANDRNVTPELVQSFARRFPIGQRPAVEIEPSFDHRCCWVQNWPALVGRILPRD